MLHSCFNVLFFTKLYRRNKWGLVWIYLRQLDNLTKHWKIRDISGPISYKAHTLTLRNDWFYTIKFNLNNCINKHFGWCDIPDIPTIIPFISSSWQSHTKSDNGLLFLTIAWHVLNILLSFSKFSEFNVFNILYASELTVDSDFTFAMAADFSWPLDFSCLLTLSSL